jgi:hypothetical protein
LEEQNADDDDDIDAALSKLEKTLDQVDNTINNKNNDSLVLREKKAAEINQNEANNNNKKTSSSPSSVELSEYLFLMKQAKYTLKKYKSFFFVLDNENFLSYFKTKEDLTQPIDTFSLIGCELLPDVNLASRKFGITIKFSLNKNNNNNKVQALQELSLRCTNEETYAKWMSAMKLASKNKCKSLDLPTFNYEVESILNLLSLQQQQIKNSNAKSTEHDLNLVWQIQASNILPIKMTKKYKIKHVSQLNLKYSLKFY